MQKEQVKKWSKLLNLPTFRTEAIATPNFAQIYMTQQKGGFQLLDLVKIELKSHMAC